MKKLLFFSILALFFCLGCKKEEEPGGYPYRFNCKINGVFWEAKYREHEGSFSRNDLDVSLNRYDKDTSMVNIVAINRVNGENLVLVFPMVQDTTKMTKNYVESCFSASYRTRCDYDYKLDNTNVNRITINSFDKNSQVLKGNFELTIVPEQKNCKDTLHITEGYFDVKYYRD